MIANPDPEVTTVVILDVDGVISPIRGATAWGDDVTAGDVWGPIIVSPQMCTKLDQIASNPQVGCYWLTDWTAKARAVLDPFPGKNWPVIAESIPGTSELEEWAGQWWEALPWWKWWALDRWLTDHPGIRKLVWVDDHLSDYRANIFPDPDARPDSAPDAGPSRRAWTIETALTHGARVVSLLIAPHTNEGLTPDHMWLIQEEIHGTMG